MSEFSFKQFAMDNLRSDIKADFERVIRTHKPRNISPTGGLSEYDVLKAHYIISDYFISEGEEVFWGSRVLTYYHLLLQGRMLDFVVYKNGRIVTIKWAPYYLE